jgi:type II secretion system protein N
VWRRWLIVSGYAGYGIALFVLFIYVTFPAPQVRNWLLTSLRHQGVTDLHIDSVQRLFPPGLALRQVRLGLEANGQRSELVRIPVLRVYLTSFLPFANRLRVRFDGELYGGHILGEVTWGHEGEKPRVELHADVRDVRLDGIPSLASLAKAAVKGRLMGSMTLWMPGSRWQEGEGRLVFQTDAGGLSGIEVMGIRLPALAYDQLGGELALRTRSVVVREILVRGRDWQLALRGEVGLTEPLTQSSLDLILGIRSSEALEQQLGVIGALLKQRRERRETPSFRIGGTLSKPSITPKDL